MATRKVMEIQDLLTPQILAQEISRMWDLWNNQRSKKMQDWVELREYLFATDTTQTSNSALPWKNKTTRPKLTQIRDNLAANYISALFPNDEWMRWEGFTAEAESVKKRKAITAYMQSKILQSDFRQVIERLVLDYIDYGNAFADVEFVKDFKEDIKTGLPIPNYIGPVVKRISPYDIVFNPLALSFNDSPKITRSIKTFGELKKELKTNPDAEYITEILSKMKNLRSKANSYTQSDWAKAAGFQVDGFGNLQEYYQSGYVEILEFEGDIHDKNGELQENQIITVVDRLFVVRHETNPSWISGSNKVHSGWRKRPDTLWAMGPLDNLVGMQYRIDHLENLKADAMDLAVQPPLIVTGNVEEFTYGPLEEIRVGEGGGVVELGKNLQGVMAAANDIAALEAKMEELAGAPRETMGIRSAGEKTAFEVQQLMTAAGRIFQAKLNQFEMEILEPLLNRMLEVTVRNLDVADVVRVVDQEFGFVDFLTITKEDITANGKIRPVGARHFTAQSMLIQNLQGIFNSQIGQVAMPHLDSKQLVKMIEDVMGLSRFGLFKENAQVYEQVERQRLVQTAQEDLAVESQMPGIAG